MGCIQVRARVHVTDRRYRLDKNTRLFQVVSELLTWSSWPFLRTKKNNTENQRTRSAMPVSILATPRTGRHSSPHWADKRVRPLLSVWRLFCCSEHATKEGADYRLGTLTVFALLFFKSPLNQPSLHVRPIPHVFALTELEATRSLPPKRSLSKEKTYQEITTARTSTN